MTLALLVLFAVLAAFGFFDGFLLSSLRGLRASTLDDTADVAAVRHRVDRLARTALFGGGTLGAVSLLALAVLWLGAA